jgi:hypothetical protein
MKKFLLLLALLIFNGFTIYAQNDGFPVIPEDVNKVPTDSAVRTFSRAMRILREFRIQAYVQMEWQRADSNSYYAAGPTGTNNIGTYAGGTFPTTANNRFLLRRGRFKLSFEHRNAKDLKVMDFAFQFDASPQSGFNLKDFYGRIIDPWIGWFSLQGGIFLRPFGFETPANPAYNESPEFSRVNQTILPNEVELGEAIVIESPQKFQTVYLRLDANLVNGQGVGNGSQTGTFQNEKDFIGRIKVGKMWNVGTAKLGFNASGSMYYGGVLQSTSNVYVLQKDSLGNYIYNNVGQASGVNKTIWKRHYYDGQLELKADYPLGITTLRGEYIWGIEPGQQTGSAVPLGPGNSPAGYDLYMRNFNGGMFYFVQSFKQKVKTHTIMHDITLKYDFYAPQIHANYKDLELVTDGQISNFSLADMKYTTVGIGYSFVPYTFFKLMVWYDFVMN